MARSGSTSGSRFRSAAIAFQAEHRGGGRDIRRWRLVLSCTTMRVWLVRWNWPSASSIIIGRGTMVGRARGAEAHPIVVREAASMRTPKIQCRAVGTAGIISVCDDFIETIKPRMVSEYSEKLISRRKRVAHRKEAGSSDRLEAGFVFIFLMVGCFRRGDGAPAPANRAGRSSPWMPVPEGIWCPDNC